VSRKGDGDPFSKPGPRDELVTRRLREELERVGAELKLLQDLDPVEAPARLSRHATEEVRRGLDPEEPAEDQARRVNRVLRDLGGGDDGDEVALPPRLLYGIKGRSPTGAVVDLPPAPATPFSQSDLLVNAEGQPNIGSELKAELASADRVDLICAFVIWSGVRHLREALGAVVDRGGQVRVITTTYMGATEKRAVDELFSLGAEVRVALDARTTKLHAKAWLLERDSGLDTAFVGSSNLSHTALFDGLEWNVRLSSVDARQVIDRVRMTFASHWESEHFESYDPERNGDELSEALREHNRRSLGETSTISFANLDVRAYQHQQRMLETLELERERHDRHRNLVVAATGTGKTVVAALDYRQLAQRLGGRPSLLFVAHREEILRQSLATYRAVMRDGSFGELLAGGREVSGEHVFAMVQSLSPGRIAAIDPEAFDVVVVDEFHHAKAASYDRLLGHLRPKELLGLTATPERLDGQDVTDWFDGRIAVELRLWEAIDQGFLVPFQYFGVADGVDLEQVTWRRGGYAPAELSNLYTGDDHRVSKVLEAIKKIVLDPGRMRALGFCVSTEHAHFMARKFTEAGLPSVALTGEDAPEDRVRALADLARGDLRCIFSVEVLGEGVDVPDVDCLLLLRPTESATLFTQQLGRGLRQAEGKSHLTVIDLIGQHRKEFRFDNRLTAIVDRRRGPIADQVEAGFPFLPAGCSVELDRQSTEVVLENLREATRRSRPARMVADLKQAGESITLAEFLDPDHYDHRIEDVYRGSDRCWTSLRRQAGLSTAEAFDAEFEKGALRNLSRLAHVDDAERSTFYRDLLARDRAPDIEQMDTRQQRLLTMLAWGLGSGRSGRSDLGSYLEDLWKEEVVRDELLQLLAYLEGVSRTRSVGLSLAPEIPLSVHARYSREEILAALGSGTGVNPRSSREGILRVDEAQADAFFVTLKKAERDYSPSTMYRDYAINRELFHWESQSGQAPHQPTVQRYINHRDEGRNILLFVRDRKRNELGTTPFTFLGPAEYVSHEGEYPVQFVWRLKTPMPAELFESARSVAAA
jgi:superfamily II DNA or RNA helicase